MRMSQQLHNNALVREILKNYCLSLFEPNPVNLTAVKELEVTRAKKAINLANGVTAARFNESPINRSSFLAACFEATYDEPIEHLIVGYGFKYRNTTKVSYLHHVIGDKGSVTPTVSISDKMRTHTTEVRRGEVLIFHNHPQWFLNILTDNLPLASSADRTIAAQLKFNSFQLLKSFFGTGDVKLYVGENGYVKEFVLPPFDCLMEFYRQAVAPNDRFKAITH